MDFGVTGKSGGYYLAEQYRKNAAGKSGGVSFVELVAAKAAGQSDVSGISFKDVTMPPVAAQMMMKAVDFLLLVPYPSDLLYPYSGDTSTLQSTL